VHAIAFLQLDQYAALTFIVFMDEQISPTKNNMAERIQELLERVLLSLPSTLHQRSFAYLILAATENLEGSDSVTLQIQLEQHYRLMSGDATLLLHRDNIEQIAQLIHSSQAAAIAEAANRFLHLGDDGHPPAVIRGGNNIESISDLTGEDSARTEGTNSLSESTG
jgi:hypothetical protein